MCSRLPPAFQEQGVTCLRLTVTMHLRMVKYLCKYVWRKLMRSAIKYAYNNLVFTAAMRIILTYKFNKVTLFSNFLKSLLPIKLVAESRLLIRFALRNTTTSIS